jgi:hypothetical protein
MYRVEQLGFRYHGVGLILTNATGFMLQFPNSSKGSGHIPATVPRRHVDVGR